MSLKPLVLFVRALSLSLVLAFYAGLAWTQGSARPFEAVYLSSTQGSGPYEMAQLIGKYVNQKAGGHFKVLTPETSGYVYNLKVMANGREKWRNHIFGATTASQWMGSIGLQPLYDAKYVLPDTKILVGNALYCMFFVTLNPEIKSLADLQGKRIGLGLRGQSHFGGLGNLYLELAGVTPTNSKIDYLGPGPAIDALLDGRVDAAIAGIVVEPSLKNKTPLPPLVQLAASGRPFYYLMPDPSVAEKLNKERGAPFMLQKLPAGSMPAQTRDFVGVTDMDTIMLHASFPEPVAYEITKTLIGLAPDMGKYHAMGKMWTPEMLSFGLTEANAHPGAIRALKEAGLWKGK